jgi:hypothetical protein
LTKFRSSKSGEVRPPASIDEGIPLKRKASADPRMIPDWRLQFPLLRSQPSKHPAML